MKVLGIGPEVFPSSRSSLVNVAESWPSGFCPNSTRYYTVIH